MNIFQPHLLQGLPQATSGFRAPNINNLFGATSFPSPFNLPPTTSTNLLTRNLFAQTNPQLMTQLLTQSSVASALGTEGLLTTAAPNLINATRIAEETQNPVQEKEPVKPVVASPPMECDSSVPSPPKAPATIATVSTPVVASPERPQPEGLFSSLC